MKGIYKLNIDYGRMGEVEGVFIDTEERVNALIGKYIYFGEILGKHSEICGHLESGDVELLTTDQKAVEVVEKYKLESGYNPFYYYTCNDCGDEINPVPDICKECKNE